MILPSTNLDNSAQFELNLADQLSVREPNAQLYLVDLSPFTTLKAKIDCIAIRPTCPITEAEKREMYSRFGSRVKIRRDRFANREVQLEPSIGLQDPNPDDLRFLMQRYPTARVTRLEIAIDAKLPYGENDIYLLRRLKEQLRHCLAPQAHPDASKLQRKYFDLGCKRYVRDPAKYEAPLTTVIWEGKSGPRVSLYIKTIDNNRLVPEPFLRTEVMLDIATCGDAGLNTTKDLPVFAKELRKYCSPAFYIACGFKHDDAEDVKWKSKGAVWDISKNKNLGLRPDSDINRAYGAALNELSRRLQRLGLSRLNTETYKHFEQLHQNDCVIVQAA